MLFDQGLSLENVWPFHRTSESLFWKDQENNSNDYLSWDFSNFQMLALVYELGTMIRLSKL